MTITMLLENTLKAAPSGGVEGGVRPTART